MLPLTILVVSPNAVPAFLPPLPGRLRAGLRTH